MTNIEIIIETIKGSNVKYRYDEGASCFKVKKILPLGMVFPYHFGFIPGTKGEDGDPLDGMVISEFSSFTGAHLLCRLIGALIASQSDKGKTIRNDRYFFVPVDSLVFRHIHTLDDFGKEHNGQLKIFSLTTTGQKIKNSQFPK